MKPHCLILIGALTTSAFAQAPTERHRVTVPGAAQTFTTTGCVFETTDTPSVFLLVTTADNGAEKANKMYRLSPSAGIDLKAQAGRKVQVTGKPVTRAASTNPEKTGKVLAGQAAASPLNAPELSVTALKPVAESCSPAKTKK